jgi:anthranilate synthase component 2
VGLRILLLDNYDSFTYNLVQYLGELGAELVVRRNDQVTLEGIAEAGVSLEAIRSLAGELPILGVCLGHQAIGQAFGGRVIRNDRIVHGKSSPVLHRGEGVYAGLPSPFDAGRYHSLVVERASLPRELRITSWTREGEIMGLRHRRLEIEGVQFHPESILTGQGKALLGNWVARVKGWRRA